MEKCVRWVIDALLSQSCCLLFTVYCADVTLPTTKFMKLASQKWNNPTRNAKHNYLIHKERQKCVCGLGLRHSWSKVVAFISHCLVILYHCQERNLWNLWSQSEAIQLATQNLLFWCIKEDGKVCEMCDWCTLETMLLYFVHSIWVQWQWQNSYLNPLLNNTQSSHPW